MFFKTYQKLLGASCLALYLMGCGSGGGGESPVEIRVSNKGDFQIRSKADSVTIQGVKLNRGNCVVRFSRTQPISVQDFKDKAKWYESQAQQYAYEERVYGPVEQWSDLMPKEDKERLIEYKKKLADMQNEISQLKQKGVMMEPQILKFGESLKGISQGCNIIEAEIQTNKGSWTFNFNR
ncbi:hypothetical protein KVM08_06900 [Helicobacter pylori]|nr:hypothetical protein KVM08_06900 [Helicobacter pylori]